MIIYLYKKTHNITGLQYLGKTVKDPFKYLGSGTRWLSHIKKHGYHITTEIIKECHSTEEIVYWGRYYSNLWNVVQDNKWANLKPEEGDGYASGPHNPMNKSHIKEKVSGKNHHSYDHNLYHLIHDSGIEKYCTRQDFINEFNLSAGNVHSLLHGNWITYKGWRLYKNKDVNYKEFKSKTNSKFDHKIYHFVHIDGTEEKCTQWELRKKYNLGQSHTSALARGDRKSYKGWKLVICPEDFDG